MGQANTSISDDLDPEYIQAGKKEFHDMIQCSAAVVVKSVLDGRKELDELCDHFLLLNQMAIEAQKRMREDLKEDASSGAASLASQQGRYNNAKDRVDLMQTMVEKGLGLENVEMCQKLFRVNAIARTQKIDVQLPADAVPKKVLPAFDPHPGGPKAALREIGCNVSGEGGTLEGTADFEQSGPVASSTQRTELNKTRHEERQHSRSLKTYKEFMDLRLWYGDDLRGMQTYLEDYLAAKEMFDENGESWTGNRKERLDWPWERAQKVVEYLDQLSKRLKPPPPRTLQQMMEIQKRFQYQKEMNPSYPWRKKYRIE